jgi:RimJ/RimL family protein N-acetyltransferase
VNIEGRVVALRALEEADMELLRSFHNDPEIARQIVGWSFPISATEQRLWYEKVIADPVNKRFAIDAPDIGFVGISTLTQIDWKYRSAFHGILIGCKEAQGRGLGTDSVMATMRYAFDELGLERLDGEIGEFNERSKRLYVDKCAWTIEGVRRRAIFRENRWYDTLIVGILASDYRQLVRETAYWG